MAVTTVLFDFDGTIADTLPSSFHAFQTVFRRFDDREVAIPQLIAMFGPTEEAILERHMRNRHRVAEAVELYYALYRDGHGGMSGSGDILDMLRAFQDKGIKLGIVTGKTRRAYNISADALGLGPFFDVIVTGDDVGRAKPHPEGVRLAMDRLGAKAAETVFVGDSSFDIEAGQAAGVRTVGVRWLSVSQSASYSTEPDAYYEDIKLFQADVLGEIERCG